MAAESLRQLRAHYAQRLDDRLEAELLIAHALGRTRAWLFAHLDDAAEHQDRILALVERRAGGEPIAYILGRREFYGREFEVDPAVLIPRPETELLIELALELDLPNAALVLDIGTGSGCIALTLAAERPGWRVTATDLSADALAVAVRNRERLELERVELVRGDLFVPVGVQRFNLIVSNPPYIAGHDPHLRRGDLRFEPAQALACGDDGLAMIRRLVDQSIHQLNPQGWLLIEHGYDQASAVGELMSEAGFKFVHAKKDLAGIERACLGQMV